MSEKFEMNEYTQVILRLDDPDFLLVPGAYWTEYSFGVYLQDEEERQVKIGMMRAHRLNMCRVRREETDLFEAFDQYASFAVECYPVVFDKKGEFKKAVLNSSEDFMGDEFSNFHILERIDLDPKYKGRGIAAEVTRIYLEEFANDTDVIYVKGYPLQFEAGVGTERKFKGTLKKCQEKLCRYYETMGMVRLGKSDHFVFTARHFLWQFSELAFNF